MNPQMYPAKILPAPGRGHPRAKWAFRLKHFPSILYNKWMGTITSVRTSVPAVALTFDDGPDAVSTPQVLDRLQKHGARGTFFMIGQRAVQNPDVVARVKAGGHAIGNHTWDHPSLPYVRHRERIRQFRRCAAVLPQDGERLFRPPYGDQTVGSRFDLLLMRYCVVTWSIVIPDWLDSDAETIADGICSSLRPGSIVLLHDALFDAMAPEHFDRGATAAAVDLVLSRMRSKYEFVSVPELLKLGKPCLKPWTKVCEVDHLNQLMRSTGTARRYPLK